MVIFDWSRETIISLSQYLRALSRRMFRSSQKSDLLISLVHDSKFVVMQIFLFDDSMREEKVLSSLSMRDLRFFVSVFGGAEVKSIRARFRRLLFKSVIFWVSYSAFLIHLLSLRFAASKLAEMAARGVLIS